MMITTIIGHRYLMGFHYPGFSTEAAVENETFSPNFIAALTFKTNNVEPWDTFSSVGDSIRRLPVIRNGNIVRLHTRIAALNVLPIHVGSRVGSSGIFNFF